MDTNVKRGDIFYADLSPVVGSEQGGTRPVLIVQNDTGNRHSPTVIAAAITSQTGKARLPTHISLSGHDVGLSRDSIVLLEQIRTIDKRRLREHMGGRLGHRGQLRTSQQYHLKSRKNLRPELWTEVFQPSCVWRALPYIA